MKVFFKFLGVYIAFLAQCLVFEKLNILSTTPDILVVSIVITSVSASMLQSMWIGFFAGILADSLYGQAFGVNILIYMALSILVNIAVKDNTQNSPLLMSWVTFVSVSALEILLILLKSLFGFSVSIEFLGANILVKGVLGAVFTLFFVAVHQHFKKKKSKKDFREGGAV